MILWGVNEMRFIHFNENGYLLDNNGAPFYLAGINYVARYVCTNFWEDWRPDSINADLLKVREIGLNAVRIPIHWGCFEPEERKYNEQAFQRFDWFIKKCREYGLYVMPWFLVGVATNEYDVPFRNGRPFFTGDMVDIAADHLGTFAKRYRDEENILAWDICDEPEWYSRLGEGAETLPYDRVTMQKWVSRMYQAMRCNDPNHLITLGFGHIGTNDFGMDIREMAKILDFMAVTAYPSPTTEGLDKPRSSYFISYSVLLNKLGKPVFLCESPGHSSVLYSEEVIGRMFQMALYSSWMNGSAGAMPWALNDFDEDIWQKDPLDRYPPEVSFGIVGENGKLKSAACRLQEFASVMKTLPATDYAFPKPDAAILLPRGYYDGLPNSFNSIYLAFILARSADIPVDLVWWDQDLFKFKLVIITNTDRLTTPDWDAIRRYVEHGGTLLCIPSNRGVLNGYFNRLFGVEVQSPQLFGEGKQLQMTRDWHELKKGSIVKPDFCEAREYMRVYCVNAETLAAYKNGDNAIICNSYGRGKSILITCNILEGLLNCTDEKWASSRLFDIFEAVSKDAGVVRTITSSDKSIETALMPAVNDSGWIAIAVNHEDFPINTDIELFLSDIDVKIIKGEPATLQRYDDRLSLACRLPAAGVLIAKITKK